MSSRNTSIFEILPLIFQYFRSKKEIHLYACRGRNCFSHRIYAEMHLTHKKSPLLTVFSQSGKRLLIDFCQASNKIIRIHCLLILIKASLHLLLIIALPEIIITFHSLTETSSIRVNRIFAIRFRYLLITE